MRALSLPADHSPEPCPQINTRSGEAGGDTEGTSQGCPYPLGDALEEAGHLSAPPSRAKPGGCRAQGEGDPSISPPAGSFGTTGADRKLWVG